MGAPPQPLRPSTSAAFFRPLLRGEEREVGKLEWAPRKAKARVATVAQEVVVEATIARTLGLGDLRPFAAVATALRTAALRGKTGQMELPTAAPFHLATNLTTTTAAAAAVVVLAMAATGIMAVATVA